MEEKLNITITITRAAYNLAIEKYKAWEKGNPPVDKYVIKKEIREHLRGYEIVKDYFPASSVNEAVLDAAKTASQVIKQRSSGKSSDFSFKSKKNPRQSFWIAALSKKYVSSLGHMVDTVPEEAYRKMNRIVKDGDEWYLCARRIITTEKIDLNQNVNVVSVDPGVRTFATLFSSDSIEKWGDGFYENQINPLYLKLDKLISKRDKVKGDTQYDQDTKRYCSKKINKLRKRVKNLIHDLHKRLAYHLVTLYDVILLPTFETKKMVSNLPKVISRSMMSLSHHNFKEHLKWMARKYGKLVVDVNESYTSRTDWTGAVHKKLGSRDIMFVNDIVVDRDINGARNILIRALTQGNLTLNPEPYGSCGFN